MSHTGSTQMGNSKAKQSDANKKKDTVLCGIIGMWGRVRL